MSAWRRKAIELFPDRRRCFERGDATVYTVFFELLPRCIRAHELGDAEELRRIYGYAAWCHRQKAKDLWNAAGVAFYEHLADERPMRDEFHEWVEPDILESTVLPLLEWRLGKTGVAEIMVDHQERRRKPPARRR